MNANRSAHSLAVRLISPPTAVFFLLLLDALLLPPSHALAQEGNGILHDVDTYYVNQVSGNDQNDGLSESTPWKTIARVTAQSYVAGDRVLFHRGDTWKGETLRPNRSGDSYYRMVFGAYGTGARPIIDVSDSIPEADSAGRWTYYQNMIWYMTLSTNPGRVYLNSQEYPVAHKRSDISSTYRWWWNALQHRLYIWTGSSADPSGKPSGVYSTSIEGSVIAGRDYALEIDGKSYLTFQGLDLRGGYQTVRLENNADYCTFDSCYISERNAGYSLFVTGGSDQGIVRYCRVDKVDFMQHTFEYGFSVSDSTDSTNTYGNAGDNISIQDGSNWDIHHNFVAGMSHDGIGFNTTQDDLTNAAYNKAHDNELYGTNDYSRPFNVQGSSQDHQRRRDAALHCRYNEIYNNYVHNCTEQVQFQGLGNRFYNNLVDTVRYSWGGGSGKGSVYQCVGISVSNDDDRGGDSCLVENNIFRNIPGPGIQIRCPRSFVRNNTCINTGLGADTIAASHIGINLWKTSYTGSIDPQDTAVWGCDISSNTCLNGDFPNPYVFREDFSGGSRPQHPMSAATFNAHTGELQNTLVANMDLAWLRDTLAGSNWSSSPLATQYNNQRKLYRESSGKLSEVFESGGEIFYNDITTGTPTLTRWLSNSSGANSAPCIAVMPSAYLVSWQERTPAGRYRIYVSRSTDGGGSWHRALVDSVECASPGPLPSLAASTSDSAFLAYASLSGLISRTLHGPDATWGPRMNPIGTGSANSPSSAMMSYSTWHNVTEAHLAYASDSVAGAPAIYYNYYDLYARSWGTAVNVGSIIPNTGILHHANPSLALDADGSGNTEIHVAWDARDPEYPFDYTRVILHRRKVTSWENQYTAFRYQGLVRPSITGLAPGTAYMVYQNATGSQNFWKVKYSWTGPSPQWGSPSIILNGFNPQISIGSSSARYISTGGTTSPYQINLGTETLAKTDAESPWVYLRALNLIEPETGAFLSLELGDMELHREGGEVKAVSFQRALADSGVVPALSAVLECGVSEQLSKLLPTDTLEVSYQFLSSHPELFQSAGDSATFSINVVKEPTGEPIATLARCSLGASVGKGGGISKACLPLATISGGALAMGTPLNVRPVFSGITEKAAMIRSLGHIYQMLSSEEPLLGKDAASADAVPTVYELLPNYPNPFNPQTHISYGLPKDAFVSLVIYDILGREVERLVDGFEKAGRYTVAWTPRSVATGVYFARLVAKDAVGSVKYAKVDKLLLLK